jgi:hypothetical protein
MMTRFFQFAAGMIVIAIVVAGLNWSSVFELGIRHDLYRIASHVRKSALSLQQKEHLLDRIDAIRERVRHGQQPSLISWQDVSNSIDEMIDSGIRGDAPRLIERELERITNEIDEIEPDHFSRKQERQPQEPQSA